MALLRHRNRRQPRQPGVVPLMRIVVWYALSLLLLFLSESVCSSNGTSELESYFDVLLAQDDVVRASFSLIDSESRALSTVSSVQSLVQSYASIRRYQRALGLLEVSKPPVLNAVVYSWKLAPLEAQMLACYEDVNAALLVLHRARDDLLKFLGAQPKEALASYFDVWTDVFGMTSQLIVWYHNGGNFNAVQALGLWMKTNGMYHSQFQLPAKYVRELPLLGPWPAWSDFSFLDLASSQSLLRSYKSSLLLDLSRFAAPPTSLSPPSFPDEAGCRVHRSAPEDAALYWRHALRLGSASACGASSGAGAGAEQCEAGGGGGGEGDEGEVRRRCEGGGEDAMCGLAREFERKFTRVHAISINTLSARTSIKPHFGESNAFLTLLMGLEGESVKDCLYVKVFNTEKTMGSADEENDIFFIDTSFLTEFKNVCDTPFSFLKIDFVHPQFVGSL